jgi:hypothetical protein
VNRAEYVSRSRAALAEMGPAEVIVHFAALALGAMVRAALYLCAGFGAVAVTGWSAWFAPLVAVVLAQTIGRVYEYTQRTARVEALEHIASGKAVTP